ncbi:HAD family hydrolase [Porphyrobacter sp. TH134]|uniref:HAD family hydrolase n=1 Tax=Porphyrobacter sp. TH134 TaxID=2067450 RepID=UPI000C7B2F73|nr:HAD hydrolase-like protein [Porphyrobacter sp. TH134]PLK22483.1 HAD family hydrolase [Porphyrobacter sp. TH134]
MTGAITGAMNRAIIFDLDGTLVDSCYVCVGILQQMLRERGCDAVIDPIHARGFMSRGGEAMVAGLLGDACIDPARDLATFREVYTRTTTSTGALFDGVAEGVAALSAQGHALAICSNKPQVLCEKVLGDTGLAPHFQVIVGGRPELRPKPAVDLLDATLAQLGLDPRDCIYVGDSELDHETALQRGMEFHFLTYGYADPAWEPIDCHVHEHFDDLTRTLTRRLSQAA